MGREGYLGEFEHRLLLAAMRLGTDACGMRLMEELSATVGRSVSRGSVYVTLDRIGAIRVPPGIAIQAGRHLIPGMPSEDL